jgi:hypothetical protein
VDDGEHLGGVDDAVDFQVAGVEVLALLDGLLVEGAVGEAGGVGLGEAVDFVLEVLAEGVEFVLGQPLRVQVAASLVFDQVLLLLTSFSFSSP